MRTRLSTPTGRACPGRSGRRPGRPTSAWSHDYPAAGRDLRTILAELTSLDPSTTGSNVLDLEDPAVFRLPIRYMSGPGHWTITDTH